MSAGYVHMNATCESCGVTFHSCERCGTAAPRCAVCLFIEPEGAS